MKKTPIQKAPAKKTVVKKTPSKPSVAAAEPLSASSSATQLKSPAATDPKQDNVSPSPKLPTPKPETPQAKVGPLSVSHVNGESKEVVSAPAEAQAKSEVKAVPAAKSVVKKTVVKVKSPKGRVVAKKTNKPVGAVKTGTKEVGKEEENIAANVSGSKKEDDLTAKVVESPMKEETLARKESESRKEEDAAKVEELPMTEEPVITVAEETAKMEEASKGKAEKGLKNIAEEERESAAEETQKLEDDVPVDMVDEPEEGGEEKEVQAQADEHMTDKGIADETGEEVLEQRAGEEGAEDDVSEPDDEGVGLEQKQISDFAKERKIKKAQEIFVGGLDRDAVEDDVKKAFEGIGEILEVRMQRSSSTNKNKGYAFVKFADKEHADRALSELKNPIIRGKACGAAPSEDKNTLFMGNICNTWTKEAIKNKLKEYGVGDLENITLVADPRQEGFSKGFAFLEYSCHADAILAYKRLQKPDVVFGHAERTAKVAFAEPLREPDPEVMAQVRSVFIDGLPQHWDEERVREHFKAYGDIENVMLARNRPTAKRKDFGFVDFATHEAAIACVYGVNNTELGDEKSKSKVKVRLSNPLPKTQAVKGGIRGGFRIGRLGTFSRSERGSGRDERSSNMRYQRGRGYSRGASTAGRRPGEDFGSRAATSFRPDLSRTRYSAPGRGRGQDILPRRQPYFAEPDTVQPFGRRHLVDDPYLYNERGHGIKRPFSMVDQEPDYMEASRLRRLHHLDPLMPSRGSHYEDAYGAGSGAHSHDYYTAEYGPGAYSSSYGREHSYRDGYYY